MSNHLWTRVYQQPLTRGINIPSAWRTPVSQIANAVAPRERGEGGHDPLETPGQRAADSPGSRFHSATGTMASSPTIENKIPESERAIGSNSDPMNYRYIPSS